ncbi:MAG: hypothetical protein R6W66_02035 [Pelovirga sp.]
MLKEQLTALKTAAAGRIPADTLKIMLASRTRLAASGILETAISTGDRLPDFSLAAAGAQTVALDRLRRQGPVIIHLYRGVW